MYRTTYADAKREATIVNRKFFRLPSSFVRLRIANLGDYWAFAHETTDLEYFIALNNRFPSYKLFRSVVAHEMIHLWQFSMGMEGDHDSTFFRWAPLFRRHGYIIKEFY